MLSDFFKVKTEPDVETAAIRAQRIRLETLIKQKISSETDDDGARQVARKTLRALADDKNELS